MTSLGPPTLISMTRLGPPTLISMTSLGPPTLVSVIIGMRILRKKMKNGMKINVSNFYHVNCELEVFLHHLCGDVLPL